MKEDIKKIIEIFEQLIEGHDPEITLDTRQCLELFDEGLEISKKLLEEIQ